MLLLLAGVQCTQWARELYRLTAVLPTPDVQNHDVQMLDWVFILLLL